jgi:hypothetical protein
MPRDTDTHCLPEDGGRLTVAWVRIARYPLMMGYDSFVFVDSCKRNRKRSTVQKSHNLTVNHISVQWVYAILVYQI